MEWHFVKCSVKIMSGNKEILCQDTVSGAQ